MSNTPLLDDLRAMLVVAPLMTRMRAPISYVQELNKELSEHYAGDDDTLTPGDVYQVSFPGDPSHVITLEVF